MTGKEAIYKLIGYRRFIEKMAMTIPGFIFDAEPFDMAISALEKQEQDRWIPVTKRLPEVDQDVLVTVHFLGLKQTHPNGWNDHIKPSFYVDIAKHYSGEWCSASDEYKVARSRHIVTAWRPLPEAYTEDNDDKS